MNKRKSVKGQSMTEYMLIVAAIAITVMGGFNTLGQTGKTLVNKANAELHASNTVAVASIQRA